ncbi:MAG: TonB-dependent receptor [Bacteroidota bacterium]
MMGSQFNPVTLHGHTNISVRFWLSLLGILFSFHTIGYGFGDDAKGQIKGVVVEAETQDPLIGANVIIKGSVIGSPTDIEGVFTINGVEEGVQILQITYLGFESKEVEVQVRAGQTTEVTIELEPMGFEGEEVVITAQARGQIAAINEQRSSNTITNIVSKDRIEDVPDVNAAESIGRLPGVSIQRSGGEANKVAIRGLSPKFNNVLVNGARIPSIDATDRGVDLSLVSSNMLDGIEVSKAITPDMDGDAIGGTINLRLRTAPEKSYYDFRFQGGYTELQNDYGNYRFVGSTGERFFENKLGVIANINLDRFDRSADTFNGGYELRPDPNNNDVPSPRIQSLNLNESALNRSRIGGSAVIDYRLPEGKLVGNFIYNEQQNEGVRRTNRFSVGGNNANQHVYQLTEFDRTSSVTNVTLNFENAFPWFELSANASFGASRNNSPNERYWDFVEEGAAPGEALTDEVLFGDPRDVPPLFFNDSTNTFLNFLSIRDQRTAEDEYTFDLNLKRSFTMGKKLTGYVKTGAKYRTKSRSNDVQSLGSNDLRFGGGENSRTVIFNEVPELGIPPNSVGRIPMEPLIVDDNRSNFLNGDYPLGFGLQRPTLNLMTDALLNNNLLFFQGQASLGNDYSGQEDYSSAYVMGELTYQDFTLLGGVRYEREETDYSANFVPPSTVAPGEVPTFVDTSAQRTGDFFLPMVHARYSPADWVTVRLAYTESISRPDFTQYAPITFIQTFGQFVNAPNTELRSSLSRNYDASIAFYQSKMGFFTVSAFHKEISDLIRFVSFPLLEGQEILPDIDLQGFVSGEPLINTFVNNTEVATVTGVELDWQTNFWYLPQPFKGIVLNLNLTILESETQYPVTYTESVPITPRPRRPPFNERILRDTLNTGRVPDQADFIANATIGYDYKGFSGRLSFYYQGEVFTGNFGSRNFEVDDETGEGFFTSGDDVFTDDLYRIDLTLSQKVNEKFEVFCNLNNLNNEFDQNFQSDFGFNPTFIQYYGFTMDVGVRARF